MQEGPVLQHGHHIGVVELLNVVDAGHAMDHLLLAELFQGLKVKMPEILMPTPCLIVLASSKAKGVCHLHMKHVKAVASPVHLGEKEAASIPDAQHAVLDLHP